MVLVYIRFKKGKYTFGLNEKQNGSCRSGQHKIKKGRHRVGLYENPKVHLLLSCTEFWFAREGRHWSI